MPEIRLLVREPGQSERRVTLFSGATIGRAQGSGLTLGDPAVSRAHLRLVCEGGGWFAEDIGSSTGTLVDGGAMLRKGERVRLTHGMRLVAGDTEIEVALEHSTQDLTSPNARMAPPLQVENTIAAVPMPGKRKPALRQQPAPAGASPVPPVAPAQPPAPELTMPPPAEPELTMPAPPLAQRGVAESPPADTRLPAEPSPAPPPVAEPEPPAARADLGGLTRRVDTREQEGIAVRPKLLARGARLVVVGAGLRQSIPVEQSPFTVGRGASAQLALNDSSISTEHAQVRFSGDRFLVTDRGSTNGTFVAGERLAAGEERPLTLPVALRFGTVETWFVDDRSASARQARIDRRAGAWLVRAGRLGADDCAQAMAAARAGRRHLGETVLLQTRLTVAEWADAVQQAGPPPSIAGRFLLFLLLLASAGGATYWLFWRR